MNEERVYCYPCDRQVPRGRNAVGDNVCSVCSSEFCELVEVSLRDAFDACMCASDLALRCVAAQLMCRLRPRHAQQRLLTLRTSSCPASQSMPLDSLLPLPRLGFRLVTGLLRERSS